MLQKLSPGVVCLFCGIAMPAGFAPYGYFIIPVVAVSLLLHLSLNLTPEQAARYGYLFGLGMFGVGVNWLHISINLFGGVHIVGAMLVTLLLVLFLALYPALIMYAGRRYFTRRGPNYYLLAICLLWILAEWARAWIFTGFPWLHIAYAHTDSPLGGIAPVAGVYGTGLASILTSAMLVQLYLTRSRQRLMVLVASILLWTGAWLLGEVHWTKRTGRNISVALIQGAVPQTMKWGPDYTQKFFDQYLDLTTPYWNQDLVVWPETALPVFYTRAGVYIEQLQSLTRPAQTELLVGLPVDTPDTGQYFNSAIMIGDSIAIYQKRHLVPFGEYLPLKPLLQQILDFLDIPMSDFSPGATGKPLFISNKFSAGISICYEAAFGKEIIQALPEAEVLINISNDAWFGDSLAPHQHLQMARMRAMETGRYLLRSTNTGITAIINEKGALTAQAEQFTPNATAGIVPLFQGMTPYAYTGDLPIVLLCFLALAGLQLCPHREDATKRN